MRLKMKQKFDSNDSEPDGRIVVKPCQSNHGPLVSRLLLREKEEEVPGLQAIWQCKDKHDLVQKCKINLMELVMKY